jgi:hypothetical protein
MIDTIRFLVRPPLNGRGFGMPALDRTAEFIAGELSVSDFSNTL